MPYTVNPFTGELDYYEAGGDLSAYAKLAGRPGSANDLTLSTDDVGTIYGSADATKGLQLASSTSITPQVGIQQNGLGLDRLLIGPPGSDPTAAFAPGGLLQFLITADENVSGVPALFGAYSLNGGYSNGATLFGIGANGSIASPTTSLDGDNLLTIKAMGFDSTNSLIGNPGIGAVLFVVDGDSTPGVLPGQLIFLTTNSAGIQPGRLWIRGNGNIGIGDDFHDSTARLHVRNEDPATIATIFQAHQSQTADITNWDSKVMGSVSADASVSDLTITLADSTAFASSGIIYVRNNDPIYLQRPVAYSANNTGTGVLTLVSPLVQAISNGETVYQSQVLAGVDASGNVFLVGGGAKGYIQIGEFDTTNDAPAPSAGQGRLYMRDNGGGKVQLVARFPTGAVQVLATEP